MNLFVRDGLVAHSVGRSTAPSVVRRNGADRLEVLCPGMFVGSDPLRILPLVRPFVLLFSPSTILTQSATDTTDFVNTLSIRKRHPRQFWLAISTRRRSAIPSCMAETRPSSRSSLVCSNKRSTLPCSIMGSTPGRGT